MASEDFRFGISSSVQGVDLNQLLVSHPASTYFMRVSDDIPEFGLLRGDIISVDRSAAPKKNDLIVVVSPGEMPLIIMRFDQKAESLELWGVVEHLIRGMH